MTVKLRIENRVRFTAFVVVCIILLTLIGNCILGLSTADAKPQEKYIQVQVYSGDTLWSIAQEYMPANMDIREAVYKLALINNVDASCLQVGTILEVPIFN